MSVVQVLIVPRPHLARGGKSPKRYAVTGMVACQWFEVELPTLLEAKSFCRERDWFFTVKDQAPGQPSRVTKSRRRGGG